MEKISCGGFLIGAGLVETIDENGMPVLSAEGFELPKATATQLGGIKVGAGLAIAEGVLSVDGFVVPKTGTAGQVLKRTADGVEWADA